MIFFLKVLEGKVPDLAIVRVKTHDNPAPIVNFVVVKVQSPDVFQDFFPLELVVATSRKETDDPPETSEIFHVTFTTVAADAVDGATPIARRTTDNLIKDLIE